MNMDRYIDIYCERLEPGLWAEPVNAITNASFFIAALMAFLLARRENALDWRSLTLILLTLGMGIGSTLFHTVAELWAMLADVLPILLYQMAFLVFYASVIMKWRWFYVLGLLFLFILTMQGFMQLPREWLNGSLEYAPALIFLSGFAAYHIRHAARERFGLALAALTFVISLTFRSIDMALCDDFPLGTHFMWHILNGLVLYLTTRAYILNRPKP